MTLEERLYLLNEMKECSEKNAEYLHTMPNNKSIQKTHFEHSFSDDSEDAFGESLMSLEKIIKSFILRCFFCTMIFLGIYMCQKQNNKELNDKITVLSNALTKEDIKIQNAELIQGKIDSTIQQILSNKTEELK